MKTLRIIFFASLMILPFLTVAQTPMVFIQGDSLNKMNNQNLKTGFWMERSGEYTHQGSYIDGKKHGNWATFLSNDMLFKLETWKYGLKDGISLQFDRKSKLTGLENYKNDQLNGLCVYYAPASDFPQKEMSYNMGKLEGMARIFYENGKIQEESFYKDNQKSGPSRWYGKTGRMIALYNYVNGQFEGLQRTFYENDTTQAISNFSGNLLNGDFKEFYRNGVLKVSGKYLKGLKEGDWIEYDEAGKRVKMTRYKNGEVK
jgi:antitoxin component YwqK of YwqJK toxin-antitoxin module